MLETKFGDDPYEKKCVVKKSSSRSALVGLFFDAFVLEFHAIIVQKKELGFL